MGRTLPRNAYRPPTMLVKYRVSVSATLALNCLCDEILVCKLYYCTQYVSKHFCLDTVCGAWSVAQRFRQCYISIRQISSWSGKIILFTIITDKKKCHARKCINTPWEIKKTDNFRAPWLKSPKNILKCQENAKTSIKKHFCANPILPHIPSLLFLI